MPKVKGSELTEVERGKVLGLRLSGITIERISKTLSIPKSTVYYTIKHYSDDVRSAPRSGRPKILDKDDQKKLKEIVNKNNRASANQLQEKFIESTGIEVSSKTIRRNLHDLGVYS